MESNSKITTPVKINLDEVIEAGTPEWYEAVEEAGGLEKMQEQLSQSIDKLVQPMREMIQEATAPAAALFTVANMISEVLENVFADVKTELETLEREYQEYTADRIAAIKEKSGPAPWIRITELAESIPFWAGVLLDYFDYIEDLGEYLEQELEKPDYDGLTMSDMLKPFPDDFNNNLWTKATQAAEKAMQEADPERYQAMLDNRRRRQQGLEEEPEETAIPAPVQNAPPVIQSFLPASHKMINGKLANDLQGHADIDIINLQNPYDMLIFPGSGRRKPLYNYTMITDEANRAIEPYSMTEYERQVIDSISSLLEEARARDKECTLTPDMIYRAMPGGGGKPSPQQKAAITKVVEKYRRVHIFIDASKEMQKRGVIGEGDTLKFDDYLLSAVGIDATTENGRKKARGYLVRDVLTLRYAKMTGQLYSIPSHFIEIHKVRKKEVPLKGNPDKTRVVCKPTPELIDMTPERQAITGYLLRQIEWMKYGRKHKTSKQRSPVITFDDIYRDVEITTVDKNKAFDIRRFVYAVLDYEQSIGYIKNYEEVKTGKKITGVKIDP